MPAKKTTKKTEAELTELQKAFGALIGFAAAQDHSLFVDVDLKSAVDALGELG